MCLGRLRALLLVVLATSLPACRPADPARQRVSVRLVEHVGAPHAMAVGSECAVGGERRPALGCASWQLRQVVLGAAEIAATRALTFLAPGWEVGRALVVKTGWRAPKPGAELEVLGDARVQPVSEAMVSVAVPELQRAAIPPAARVELWARPASPAIAETTPVPVARGAVLSVGIALDPTVAAGDGDAVDFLLTADAGGGARDLLRTTLRPGAAAWQDHRIPLDAVSGAATRFRFATSMRLRAGADPAHAAAAALWGAPEILEPVPRPVDTWNVLLVSLDTLRADHVGAYGSASPSSCAPRDSCPPAGACVPRPRSWTSCRRSSRCSASSHRRASTATARRHACSPGRPRTSSGSSSPR
jgi:hypothetical protein